MAGNLENKLVSEFSIGAQKSVDHDRNTFAIQGHNDTDTASESMRFEVRLTSEGVEVHFYAIDYAEDQSTGLEPHQINYNFDDLRAWAQRREPGLTDGEINIFLWNIINKWEEEGMPTEGSKEFSQTGERTGWIPIGTTYIDQNFDELFDINPFLQDVLDDALEPFLAERNLVAA